MKHTPTLSQLEQRHQLMAFILPVVLVLAAGVALYLGIAATGQISKKRLELATLQQTNTEKAAFNQFLAVNQLNLENLDRIVPNEAMMIGVIQDVEAVITVFDPQGTVEIASSRPAKVGTYSAITLTVKCATSLENLPVLLEKISELPYMIQLINSDTNQADTVYKHQLNLRLYVQDPFNTP